MKKSLGAGTLLYPTPVWGIGTYDKNGKPNIMTASWAGICCSKPPCVSVSLRKATYTFGNIMENKAFTVNIPTSQTVKEIDYFGLVSGRNTDKFSATGFTPIKSDLVNAPYVQEFPLVIECTLKNTLEAGLHTLFIGEIMDVKADESILSKNGSINIEKLETFTFSPANYKYYKVNEVLADAFSVGNSIKNK